MIRILNNILKETAVLPQVCRIFGSYPTHPLLRIFLDSDIQAFPPVSNEHMTVEVAPQKPRCKQGVADQPCSSGLTLSSVLPYAHRFQDYLQ